MKKNGKEVFLNHDPIFDSKDDLIDEYLLEFPLMNKSFYIPLIQIDKNKFVLPYINSYTKQRNGIDDFLSENVNLDESKYQSYINDHKSHFVNFKQLDEEFIENNNPGAFQKTDDNTILYNGDSRSRKGSIDSIQNRLTSIDAITPARYNNSSSKKNFEDDYIFYSKDFDSFEEELVKPSLNCNIIKLNARKDKARLESPIIPTKSLPKNEIKKKEYSWRNTNVQKTPNQNKTYIDSDNKKFKTNFKHLGNLRLHPHPYLNKRKKHRKNINAQFLSLVQLDDFDDELHNLSSILDSLSNIDQKETSMDVYNNAENNKVLTGKYDILTPDKFTEQCYLPDTKNEHSPESEFLKNVFSNSDKSNKGTYSDLTLFVGDKNGYLVELYANDFSVKKQWDQIHAGSITIMTLSQDQRTQFTSGSDGVLKQWDVSTGDLRYNWNKIHSSAVLQIILAGNDCFMYTAGKDLVLKKWCVETRTLIKDFGEVHEDWILTMEQMPDGNSLFTGSADKTLKQWDIIKDELQYDYGEIHDYSVTCMAITQDNLYVFTGSDDAALKQWDITNKIICKDFKRVHDDCIKVMTISNDNKYLFTGSDDMSIKMFDIRHQIFLRDLSLLHQDWIRSLVSGQIGNYLYAGSEDNKIVQYNIGEDPRLVDTNCTQLARMPTRIVTCCLKDKSRNLVR